MSPIAHNEVEEADETYQSIYAQIAIESEIGMIGFQLYYKMPKCNEMIDFISKIYLKIKDSPIEDSNSIVGGSSTKPYSKGRWLVLPNNQATYPRVINEMLKKTGLRAIILQNEQIN